LEPLTDLHLLQFNHQAGHFSFGGFQLHLKLARFRAGLRGLSLIGKHTASNRSQEGFAVEFTHLLLHRENCLFIANRFPTGL
jgi:hypothetical protein